MNLCSCTYLRPRCAVLEKDFANELYDQAEGCGFSCDCCTVDMVQQAAEHMPFANNKTQSQTARLHAPSTEAIVDVKREN